MKRLAILFCALSVAFTALDAQNRPDDIVGNVEEGGQMSLF